METSAQTFQTDTESLPATGEPDLTPAAPTDPDAAPSPSKPAPAVQQPSSLAEIIASQLESLEAYHAAVLETEDVEAVHKMRVTTRRLQASLDLLQSGANEFKIRSLKRRLRRWRRRLSLVRNYDVFLQMIDAEASAGRSAHQQHFELLRAELQKRRAQEALKVDKYLRRIKVWSVADRLRMTNQPNPSSPSEPPPIDSPEGQAQSSSFSLHGAEPAADTAAPEPAEPEASAEPVPAETVTESAEPAVQSAEPAPAARSVPTLPRADEKRVARRAADRLDQRLAEFKTMAAEAEPSSDSAEIHQLRIAAKRLRYLMEEVSRLGYGDASLAIGWLRSLQDHLGDWHDIDAFEDEVIDIVSRRKFMKANLLETSGVLHATARLLKKKETLIRKTFPVKPPAVLGRTSTRLSRALRRRASLGPARN